jgi:hypothetical protein
LEISFIGVYLGSEIDNDGKLMMDVGNREGQRTARDNRTQTRNNRR